MAAFSTADATRRLKERERVLSAVHNDYCRTREFPYEAPVHGNRLATVLDKITAAFARPLEQRTGEIKNAIEAIRRDASIDDEARDAAWKLRDATEESLFADLYDMAGVRIERSIALVQQLAATTPPMDTLPSASVCAALAAEARATRTYLEELYARHGLTGTYQGCLSAIPQFYTDLAEALNKERTQTQSTLLADVRSAFARQRGAIRAPPYGPWRGRLDAVRGRFESGWRSDPTAALRQLIKNMRREGDLCAPEEFVRAVAPNGGAFYDRYPYVW